MTTSPFDTAQDKPLSPFPLTVRAFRVFRGKKKRPSPFAVTISTSVFIRVHPWQKKDDCFKSAV
jgi:hypothetical protein